MPYLNKKMQEQLRYAGINSAAIHVIRECALDGLGWNCTFIDDEVALLVGLAQRAVLAGLASDCDEDVQRRFTEAAEKHREGHERVLGRPIIAR